MCVSFHCRVALKFNVVVGSKERFHKGKPPIQRCKPSLLRTNSGTIHTEAHGNRLPWEVDCNISPPLSCHLRPRRLLRTASLPLSGACCFPLAHLFPHPSWALWWDFGWGDLRASRLCIHTPGKRFRGPVNAPSKQRDLTAAMSTGLDSPAPAAPPWHTLRPAVALTPHLPPRPTHLGCE